MKQPLIQLGKIQKLELNKLKILQHLKRKILAILGIFDKHATSSTEILRFADMAILGLSQQGSDANKLLKEMYKNIEKFCKDKDFKISVYEEWNNIKFYYLKL